MQKHTTNIDQEMKTQVHSVASQSGTFKGSKQNWATLKKEAYSIYMAFRKFSYYLEGAKTILGIDHAPLNKFMEGKILKTQLTIVALSCLALNLPSSILKEAKIRWQMP